MKYYSIFLAEFFHDLKNNLAIIKESNGLIQDILNYSLSCQDHIENIKNSSLSIDEQILIIKKKINIIDQYILFNENKINLLTLLSDVLSLLNRYLIKRQITYEIKLSSDYGIKNTKIELMMKLYIILKYLINNCQIKTKILFIDKEIINDNLTLLVKINNDVMEINSTIWDELNCGEIKVKPCDDGIVIQFQAYKI